MTNAEFLNKYFGTNYKQWMRCTYNVSKDTVVWMVNIDGSVAMGWSNVLLPDGKTIEERFVWDLSRQIPPHRHIDYNYRIVVDKSKNYKVLGFFKYDRENSDERTYRDWHKVKDVEL